LLTGGGVESFNDDVSKVIYPEGRKQFLAEQQQLRRAIVDDAQQGIADILADPDIPDEQKIHIFELDPQGPRDFSSLNILAEQATVSDSNINETGEAQQFRYMMIDNIKEAVEYKREMQAKVNALRQAKDPSTLGTLVDVAELMVPFAEWIHYDRLQADLLGDEYQLNLMGQQKQKIYEHIQSLPLAKRKELSGRILDILEDNENVVLPDGNDLLLIETMQQMLVEEDYTNFERWFDNIVSVLDVAGIGGAFAALAGDTSKAAKVAGEAKTAEEALDGEILPPEAPDPNTLQIESGEVIDGTAKDVTDRLIELKRRLTIFYLIQIQV
jgi:hypothetical protein